MLPCFGHGRFPVALGRPLTHPYVNFRAKIEKENLQTIRQKLTLCNMTPIE